MAVLEGDFSYKKNDLDRMLFLYSMFMQAMNESQKKIDMLHRDIISLMKKRKWCKHETEDKEITVRLIRKRVDKLNRKALNVILSEDSLSKIISSNVQEDIEVIYPLIRGRLKNVRKRI